MIKKGILQMKTSNHSTLTISLIKNIQLLSENFNSTSSLKIRKFVVKDPSNRDAAIIYLDGIINSQMIQDNILTPMLKMIRFDSIEAVYTKHLSVVDVSIETKIQDITIALTKGKCVILIEGFNEGILADVAVWQTRALSEPNAQRTMQGSLIGFNEQLKVNLNILQNLMSTNKLTVESYRLGQDSNTDVALVFIEGYVDEKVLEETRKRLEQIDVKYLLEERVIEDAIEGKKTIFPLVYTSERPDVTVKALYESRVAIIINGNPYVLIVPTLFVHYFQRLDDYTTKYNRFFGRLIRFFTWLVAMLLPAIYIAIGRFHTDWLPNHKLLTKTVLPLPLEVIFLLYIFNLLIDASMRIPLSIILIVSLIGSVAIGDAAVSAKLLHPISLLVVVINTLAAITLSGLWSSNNILRMTFFLLATFFGFKGIIIGLIVIIIYMGSLNSMGVPYLAPIFPLNIKEMKDVIIRGDLRKIINSKHTYPHKNDKKNNE